MTTLTVTTRGQVTFRKDVLQHLGIKPGEKIELELLPSGQGLLRAARPTNTIQGFVGLLANKTQKAATLEEIDEAAKRAWAGKKVKITADTNILIRAVVQDHAAQAKAAVKVLTEADTIAIPLPSLCEFVWVLLKVYEFSTMNIAAAIHALIATDNVEMNRPAVEAGLAVFEAGGDFADGVIAYEGAWLGGSTFVSFDKQAIKILNKQGYATKLLTV